MSDTEFSSVEPVFLMAGNLGKPGAPVINMALMYDADLGVINGHGTITQAIAPPDGRIVIASMTGQVHGLGLGSTTRVVALNGTYYRSLPPPAIGQVTEKFTATFVTDNTWKGHGTFTYGGTTLTNVPVKQRG